MKWVTRARPKTDRIACPWLIRRFIDPDAEILYVGQIRYSIQQRPRALTASTPKVLNTPTEATSAASRC